MALNEDGADGLLLQLREHGLLRPLACKGAQRVLDLLGVPGLSGEGRDGPLW